jgi:transcriptional regulator of acetoin/glycerol metabolism
VRIPPLRERCEEIPFLVTIALADNPIPIDATFIEQCALRPWPGNVRELLAATQSAARLARKQGSKHLSASHLAATAGRPLGAVVSPSSPVPTAPLQVPAREDVEAAAVSAYRAGTDVATIAQRLQISVASVYRYLKKHGVSGA